MWEIPFGLNWLNMQTVKLSQVSLRLACTDPEAGGGGGGGRTPWKITSSTGF